VSLGVCALNAPSTLNALAVTDFEGVGGALLVVDIVFLL
jgi:hypothetical protein